MQTKDLGVLYDEGINVELPVFPPRIGKYQVRIKTPSGVERSKNFEITALTDRFLIPNFNGQKKFEKGINTFYIYEYNPTRQRLEIEGYSTWAVEFKERKDDFELINENTIKINFNNHTFLIQFVPHHNETLYSLAIEKI